MKKTVLLLSLLCINYFAIGVNFGNETCDKIENQFFARQHEDDLKTANLHYLQNVQFDDISVEALDTIEKLRSATHEYKLETNSEYFAKDDVFVFYYLEKTFDVDVDYLQIIENKFRNQLKSPKCPYMGNGAIKVLFKQRALKNNQELIFFKVATVLITKSD